MFSKTSSDINNNWSSYLRIDINENIKELMVTNIRNFFTVKLSGRSLEIYIDSIKCLIECMKQK